MRFLLFISFITSICFFQPAFAVDYYWDYFGSFQASSPQALCPIVVADMDVRYPTYKHTLRPQNSYYKSDSLYLCSVGRVYTQTGTGATSGNFDVKRIGTTCTLPSVYNPETRSCQSPEPDKCESTIGNIITHQHNLGVIGGTRIPPPGSICENECQYAFGDTPPKDVYRFVNPDPDQRDNAYGAFTYKGNGVSCTSSDESNPSNFDQPPTVPPIDKTPEYNQENKCDNWVTGPDGVARRECTATNEFRQPGELKCENTNGYLKCSAGTPPPEYTKTDVTATTDKTTNPDGSTKTETTTSKDTVSCKGSKPCTSNSSETTDTEGTNPDGTESDKTSECKGTACGKPDPKPGMGDEEGEDEDEPASSVSGGATCDAPPSCEGDAIQCAILKQQFESRCDFEEAGDFEGSKSDIEALVQGEKFDLDSVDIQAPSFINSGARFLPASCPPPQQINLTSNGGHTYSLKFDPLCSFASDFSYLIMAMMGIWCAVYVGRAFGGE